MMAKDDDPYYNTPVNIARSDMMIGGGNTPMNRVKLLQSSRLRMVGDDNVQ